MFSSTGRLKEETLFRLFAYHWKWRSLSKPAKQLSRLHVMTWTYNFQISFQKPSLYSFTLLLSQILCLGVVSIVVVLAENGPKESQIQHADHKRIHNHEFSRYQGDKHNARRKETIDTFRVIARHLPPFILLRWGWHKILVKVVPFGFAKIIHVFSWN